LQQTEGWADKSKSGGAALHNTAPHVSTLSRHWTVRGDLFLPSHDTKTALPCDDRLPGNA